MTAGNSIAQRKVRKQGGALEMPALEISETEINLRYLRMAADILCARFIFCFSV